LPAINIGRNDVRRRIFAVEPDKSWLDPRHLAGPEPIAPRRPQFLVPRRKFARLPARHGRRRNPGTSKPSLLPQPDARPVAVLVDEGILKQGSHRSTLASPRAAPGARAWRLQPPDISANSRPLVRLTTSRTRAGSHISRLRLDIGLLNCPVPALVRGGSFATFSEGLRSTSCARRSS
jgi:hypothetical protein